MNSTRMNKISRLLQKELGDIFQKQGQSTFQGVIVSPTSVRVSPDLSYARVYLSIFPTEKAPEVYDIIKEATKVIRHEVATRVKSQLRKVPEIQFFMDDSLDYVEHIDKLLQS